MTQDYPLFSKHYLVANLQKKIKKNCEFVLEVYTGIWKDEKKKSS